MLWPGPHRIDSCFQFGTSSNVIIGSFSCSWWAWSWEFRAMVALDSAFIIHYTNIEKSKNPNSSLSSPGTETNRAELKWQKCVRTSQSQSPIIHVYRTINQWVQGSSILFNDERLTKICNRPFRKWNLIGSWKKQEQLNPVPRSSFTIQRGSEEYQNQKEKGARNKKRKTKSSIWKSPINYCRFVIFKLYLGA